MVRALLDGTKTQTRRVVKPRKDRRWGCDLVPHELAGEINSGDFTNTVYGQPSDRLWVREAWQGPLVDGDVYERQGGNMLPFQKPEYCRYAADGGPRPEYLDADDNMRQGWKPGIHMYRWASRITLEVTDVRVERLQDICAADAKAEGIEGQFENGPWRNYGRDGYWFPEGKDTAPVLSYRSLWEQINGAGSWAANPWVWVIEFRRIAS
ncbi:morphogenetic protein [Variovorax sp. 38R]|nr:morphogenetic protein [Variovorax sp. 38R]